MKQTAAAPPVEFDCKEKDCRMKVHYERVTQGGFAKLRKVANPGPTFAVFLTCDNGHVHRYDVPTSH